MVENEENFNITSNLSSILFTNLKMFVKKQASGQTCFFLVLLQLKFYPDGYRILKVSQKPLDALN